MVYSFQGVRIVYLSKQTDGQFQRLARVIWNRLRYTRPALNAGKPPALLLAPLLNGSTIDFTSAAAYAAATTNSLCVSFNGILPPGTAFESFNPLVLSGTSFSTPDAGTFVNLTAATF